jgi:quinol-cytochrome oxidoreductase complex cytochrome b subunit
MVLSSFLHTCTAHHHLLGFFFTKNAREIHHRTWNKFNLIILCVFLSYKNWYGTTTANVVFVCLKSDFLEIIFQIFKCLFAIRKVGQRKTLSSQKKI